ncbi:hypothetical protein Slin15195_G130200 [Septoria linicola]|uniref:Uncharacterized protein n=1 Tax=Septoria linicola TaxID=215465 RepID=A0A9Q9EQD5_9PEZI|nr:hypothetical protein Slin14017_G122090 [Septoria linicola]USW59701.1 hypothetical protein Slin15195_G130200 [Septoria linicola]
MLILEAPRAPRDLLQSDVSPNNKVGGLKRSGVCISRALSHIDATSPSSAQSSRPSIASSIRAVQQEALHVHTPSEAMQEKYQRTKMPVANQPGDTSGVEVEQEGELTRKLPFLVGYDLARKNRAVMTSRLLGRVLVVRARTEFMQAATTSEIPGN